MIRALLTFLIQAHYAHQPETSRPRKSPTMPITPPPTAAQLEFLACDQHSTTNLVGYQIWQTIDANGDLINGGLGRWMGTVYGGCRYSVALDLAALYRTGKSYAVITNVYSCGHSSAQADGRVQVAS